MKQTLEKTEGPIKNKQSRENDNIGYPQDTGRREKKHNTENLKDDQHGPHQKQRMNPDAGEG